MAHNSDIISQRLKKINYANKQTKIKTHNTWGNFSFNNKKALLKALGLSQFINHKRSSEEKWYQSTGNQTIDIRYDAHDVPRNRLDLDLHRWIKNERKRHCWSRCCHVPADQAWDASWGIDDKPNFRLTTWAHPLWFSRRILCTLLPSNIRTTCPTHCNLRDLIICIPIGWLIDWY